MTLHRLLSVVAAALWAAAAMLFAAAAARPGLAQPSEAGLADVESFRRPTGLPFIADAANEARIRLGQVLFGDKRLSGPGTHACASCHDPALAFTDGVPLGRGAAGRVLARHTPALWNLAWGETFFWDGRAPTLEDQALGPIESPLEMAGSVAKAAAAFRDDPDMTARFAEAFPGEPRVEPRQILRALAAYERTLVSPPTRFDRWVEGEAAALTDEEKAGFALFRGKAGCANCHSGWAFTDRAYHDIGLPGTDRGRGAQIGLAAADHAFRTPSLRELTWTAPYMHDGSLPTLDAVLDHYEKGVQPRPSLSADLHRLDLTGDERLALLAFLGTLSSETPPVPMTLDGPAKDDPLQSQAVRSVSQKDRQFTPRAVSLGVGETLTIVNDDTRTHNVRMDGDDPFNSGAQEPGQTAKISFAKPGTFQVYCGIHPAMRLTVSVRD
jgi:cytochrome c peroxidase